MLNSPFSPSGFRRLWRRSARPGALAAALVFLACASLSARATTPLISLIQKSSNNQILIHFDTDANRTYTVQYANFLPRRGPATWYNLYTTPNLPFPNHYVVNDTITGKQRYYRLLVTP